MANVAHSTLAGSDLHEPKGVGAATSGQIYIADGLGSGAWSSASSALSFVGQVADFITPVAPTGWLEADGSAVSRTTYAALFAAGTIQQTGTRTNSSTTVTGLSSTTNMRAGYFVGGTGITNGTTIATVDSSTQITLSLAASSSGSSTVVVSPFALGDGSTTFTLPDVKTLGRFRRSRTATVHMGTAQADQNKAHTHTNSGSTSSDGSHTHTGTTDGGGVDHTHSYLDAHSTGTGGGTNGNRIGDGDTGRTTGTASDFIHTHTFNSDANGGHTHTYSNTTGSDGGTEARPLGIVVMTCVRT